MEKVQEIIKKNEEINELINIVFQKDIETIKCENGNYSFNSPIDKIMEMEMKKSLSVYLAEFSEYFTSEKEKLEEIYQNYKTASNILRDNLDKYVQNNSDKLYDLGKNSKELSTEQMLQKQLAYNKVLELQDIEIEYLKLIVDNPVLGNLNKSKEQNDNMII